MTNSEKGRRKSRYFKPKQIRKEDRKKVFSGERKWIEKKCYLK